MASIRSIFAECARLSYTECSWFPHPSRCTPRFVRFVFVRQVDGIFVPTRAPFSKARAIQDASSRVPDDHIMFVHDADLFPPCELPDALRQTVVRGVQAVNLLLPYEGKADKGQGIGLMELVQRGGVFVVSVVSVEFRPF